jgi:hypothetical protein
MEKFCFSSQIRNFIGWLQNLPQEYTYYEAPTTAGNYCNIMADKYRLYID